MRQTPSVRLNRESRFHFLIALRGQIFFTMYVYAHAAARYTYTVSFHSLPRVSLSLYADASSGPSHSLESGRQPRDRHASARPTHEGRRGACKNKRERDRRGQTRNEGRYQRRGPDQSISHNSIRKWSANRKHTRMMVGMEIERQGSQAAATSCRSRQQ